MDQNETYSVEFFKTRHEGALRSARAVLSNLFLQYKPASMLDIGCGTGSWLCAAQELGVTGIQGIDGAYVPRNLLDIPEAAFQSQDLEARIDENRHFDLASCLEVAEHLTEARADSLVDDLCRLGQVILFSCAIPAQGGTNHINERFPSYWIPKFNRHGFHCYDFIRPAIWSNKEVNICYRQNVLVFSKDMTFPNPVTNPEMADLVHPGMWMIKRSQINKLALSLNALALEHFDKNLAQEISANS